MWLVSVDIGRYKSSRMMCVCTRMDQIQFPLLEQRRGWSQLRGNKTDTPAIQVRNENRLSHQHAVHSKGNNTHGGRPVMRNGCGEETKRERN
jgi:hypothetical protein